MYQAILILIIFGLILFCTIFLSIHKNKIKKRNIRPIHDCTRKIRETQLHWDALPITRKDSNVLMTGKYNDINHDLDHIIEEIMKKNKIPGLAIAISQNGQTVINKTFGAKDLSSKTPPDENTIFHLASISKSLTAFGIMILMDEGLLNLDSPIGNFLQEIPNNWKFITIIQLMTHTSGLPNFSGPKTWTEALKQGSTMKMEFTPPGSQQKYNNSNYALLGKIISIVASDTYENFMSRKVFIPLGMLSTGSYTTITSNNKATGYRVDDHGHYHITTHNITDYGIPSGGLVSSLADMIRWNQSITQRKLLSTRAYEIMWTNKLITNPWNFTPGWQKRSAGIYTVIAKNGMVPGSGSMFQLVLDKDSNVIVSLIILWNISDLSFWKDSAYILKQLFNIP